MSDNYGRSYSGVGFDSEGHLMTKTTLHYNGASGEQAIRNLRKGQQVRATRIAGQRAAMIRQKVYAPPATDGVLTVGPTNWGSRRG